MSALILLCAWNTSLHAQAAAFNGGITTTINASFKGPMGVTTDPSGNIFVADNNTSTNTATVYEMTRNGPGSYGTPVALPSPAGGFVCPSPVTEPDPCLRGLGLDSRGDLWVAAFGNFSATAGHVYEWVNTSGTFATPVAIGTGWKGPWGIAGDPSGNVFVSDNIANTISKISFSSGQPVVSTVVAANVVAQPRGIAVDASDNIFVIDGNLDHLEKLQSPYTSESSLNNYSFQGPGDLARDVQGNLWLSEFGTNLIREATSTLSNTVAGWGRGFSGPVSVWPAPDGTVLVSDWTNHAIKQIVPQTDNVGTVAVGSAPVTQTLQFTFTSNTPTTIKAPKVVTQGASGLDFTDLGTGTCNTNGTSRSYDPSESCTVNVSFKPKSAGTRHGAAQLISNAGTVLATASLYATGVGPQLAFAGGTFPGTFLTQSIVNPQGVAVDGTGNIYFSSGSSVTEIPPGCATAACRVTVGGGFSQPHAMAVDGVGNLYVADSGSNAVKVVPPGCASSSCVTTVSGFNQPHGVAVDNGGTIYVADTANNAVKRVVAGCSFSTCVSTLASGFNQPQGVAVDGNGNVFVADTSNSAIKEIPAGCTSSSCVIALGGGFSTPVSVAVDGVGDIYTADNHTASVMAPACSSSSCVTTVRQNSGEVYTGIAVDGSGSVYLSDSLGSGIYTLQLATAPSLTFANTHAGSQSSDSPQTVTLRNIGNAPLTFPVPGTGTNPSVSANFKLDSSTTCPDVLTSSPAGSLAAGTSCGLAIDFLPAAIGSVSGSTVLTDNNLNASPSTTQSIALSGAGTSAVPTPTVTVTPSPSSITTIQSLSVTVTLSGGSGNPVPTGTVSLSGPGYTGSPLTLSSGSATFNIPANTLSVGTDTLTASYSGSSSYTTATGSNSVTVTKATPTVTASANPTTITTLQSTVVTVSVAGTPQPTGTITLTSGGVTVGTGSLASGTVQITVAAGALAVGADTLTATYSGDGVYTTATGSTSVTVNKATPTVTASPNPATITTVQSTVVTVSVAGTPQPTGTITLTSGGVTVGSGSLASGTAQITVAASALAVGTDSLTATYSGDGTYATATGTTSVTVNKATPTVTASPNPATITTLQSTVVTVSVVGTPQPTGTITLSNGGVTVGSGSLAAGSAQITVPASALAVGANTLTATYSGDGTYTTATGTTSVTVNKATPTVTASPNPATITTLQSTVVTVSVAGTTQPTGTITLTSGGATVGSGPLVSGTAQINVPASALALGANSLTTSYSGDSTYDIATGSASVTVTKATPTVTVTPNPTTITTLQSTVVTVTVAGTAQPTGTITLTSGGVTVGSGALVSGTAQVNVSASALALGTNTLTASYSGDSNYDIAAGSGMVTIIKATPTVSASANPATITNSQSTVVMVSVDGSVQATGTITLTSGGVTVGSGSLASGATQITVLGSFLALGTDSLTATYSGDTNYATAAGSTSVTVTKTTPDVSVSATPASITTLQSTAIAVTVTGPQPPTGTVTLTNGGSTLGSGTLANGTAQINVTASALPLGTNTLTATYSGDGTFGANTGSATITVNAPVYPDNNLNSVNLGSTSTTPITVMFNAISTFASTQVLTQGVQGLDFTNAGTGTCDTNPGHTYGVGETCTIDVIFTPKFPGVRYGAVNALNSSGNVIANAYVYGTGVGPQVVFSGNTIPQTLGGGFSAPEGVAVDAAGNVFVADTATSTVKKIPLGCNSSACVSTLGGGFQTPWGVAVDGIGNIYVADTGNNAVKKIPSGCASSSCVTTLGAGFLSPTSVSIDGIGNVYVADNGHSAAKVMAPDCTSSSCVTSLGGGFSSFAVAVVGGDGNIYVADTGNNSVKKMSASCASSDCVTTVADGFHSPSGLAVDAASNLYVTNSGDGTVAEIPVGCVSSSCVTTLSSGFINPVALVLEGSGNLYVAGNASNAVYKLAFATPPTLSFATSQLGSQSSDSPQTVALRNIGNGPLTFPVPNADQNPSITANFILDASTTCPQVTTTSSAGILAAGAICNLAVDYSPTTTNPISGSIVVTDNNLNASPAVTQSITLRVPGAAIPTPLTPWVQVNNGAWQQLSTMTVSPGDSVNLGEQVLTGGSYNWSGPGGYTFTSRIASSVPLNSGANVFTLTYTNGDGASSTLTFTITVGGTTLTPYIQVNNGGWLQTNSATVSPGSIVNLGEQVLTGGNYSWSGPGGYSSTSRIASSVPLTSTTNVFTLTYTNTAGATSTATFTIKLGGTALTPWLQVNNGAWQQISTVTVSPGDTVNLGEQVLTGGSYSWSGPGGYSSISRIASSVPLTSASNIFTLTYTNTAGATSTATFTVNFGATALTPWLQVNNGGWQQISTVTASPGDTVNLGEQVLTGGSYSWSGPGGYTSTSRIASNVPLTSPTNVFTLTYTNTAGATSTATFTIKLASTPLTPWLQINNGAWQQLSSVTVSPGDTVNLSEQVLTGGSYSWSGPGGYTSTSRIASNVPLTSPTNVFTLTYTNTAGATSTATFTIKVGSTPLTPWLQVNNGAWQQTNSVTVSAGATVNLGEQVLTGGSYSWTGPNGFSASTRIVSSVPLTSATNVFTLTYTNTLGATSSQLFTITVN